MFLYIQYDYPALRLWCKKNSQITLYENNKNLFINIKVITEIPVESYLFVFFFLYFKVFLISKINGTDHRVLHEHALHFVH